MPVIQFASQDAVPEGLKEYAKETEGKWSVDVVPGVKLNEFRDNNIQIVKDRDALAGVLGKLKPVVGDDVDSFVTKYGELATLAQQVKDGKLKGTDAIQAEVDNRVSGMKTGYDNQINELNAARTAAERAKAESDLRFNRSIVERAVTEAVINEKSGALPSALPDILARAYSVFQIAESGKLVAKDGEAVVYGTDGVSPMSPLEWIAKLRGVAPYFFKGSNGGGAAGGQGGKSYGGMAKADFDKLSPTAKLSQLYKSQK